jgi:hypothetical protein
MTQQYDRTNTGALFVNDRKTTDRHPDMNGKLNINGVEHWFSGWWKQGNKGEFLSISLGAPVEQQQQPQRQQQAQPARGRGRPQPQQEQSFTDDDLSDVPF